MSSYHFHFDTADIDEDNRVLINTTSGMPLPEEAIASDTVRICDQHGDVYLTTVLDWHDAYREGGEPSFVWVELR